MLDAAAQGWKQPLREEASGCASATSLASIPECRKNSGNGDGQRRKQNRRIGRNTLLLQMINPAPASNGPKSSVSSPADESAAVTADE